MIKNELEAKEGTCEFCKGQASKKVFVLRTDTGWFQLCATHLYAYVVKTNGKPDPK